MLIKNKYNKKFNKDKKQLAFCSLRSLILANNFLPVNWALVVKEMDSNMFGFGKNKKLKSWLRLLALHFQGKW